MLSIYSFGGGWCAGEQQWLTLCHQTIRCKGQAAAADLPTRARERLAKAQRLTTQLLATITLCFATLQVQVEALAPPPHLERTLVEQPIPALYLERVAARSTHAEPRH
jgi:hypothetical protein